MGKELESSGTLVGAGAPATRLGQPMRGVQAAASSIKTSSEKRLFFTWIYLLIDDGIIPPFASGRLCILDRLVSLVENSSGDDDGHLFCLAFIQMLSYTFLTKVQLHKENAIGV
jgi:hypothetical protein